MASAASEAALHPALTADGLLDSIIRLVPPDRGARARLLGARAALFYTQGEASRGAAARDSP